jgi:beta-barrel assembly-enhancing protease
MRITTMWKRAAVVALLAFFAGCADDGINLFTVQDDAELGAEVAAEIESDPQTYPPYEGDPSVATYLETRVFEHILQSPEIEYKDAFSYRVEIIDDPETLNAFALPGGRVYVYTGLLKYLDNEAALAGVLAHEIAHAERRHATRRLTKYYGVSFLLSVLLGENPSTVAEIAANLFVGAAFLANSRDDEYEADEYSFKYLRDTRYYPGGVKFFFEQMRDQNLIDTSRSSVETFLSTHPDPIDRISEIDERLNEANVPVVSWDVGTRTDVYREDYETNVKTPLSTRTR